LEHVHGLGRGLREHEQALHQAARLDHGARVGLVRGEFLQNVHAARVARGDELLQQRKRRDALVRRRLELIQRATHLGGVGGD